MWDGHPHEEELLTLGVRHTDSVAEVTGGLVLDTATLPPEVRAATGLEELDVVLERTRGGGYGYDQVRWR